ncbi:AI-2E family transporter [Halobacteria archaeon AArc-m2/3/4]|uniref:AI-2E family transporter n=1 Tax=Natronoglomus mannanivorans TaxID=2979990 RepID=A0AAP2YW04_9EURY|nr:AI-2E family transporter [Halobacteria archaeon AArc-xg1-1]MCU4971510.1 AI-2E family transporter [Halobacteria archaeon AArc-m2/3/4]
MLGGYQFDRTRAPWWVLGALIAGVLLYILYTFIGTFVFGLFLYYATRPVYQRLVKRLGSRALAAVVSLITLAIPFMLLLAYTAAVAVQELSAAVGEDGFETLEEALEPYLDISELVSDPEQLLTSPASTDIVNTLLDNAPAYIGFFGTGALHVFVMLALAYYLLKDDHLLARWFLQTFGDDEAVLESYCTEIDRDFQNVFFGNILNAFITAIVGAFVFSVLNVWAPPAVAVPYAVLVGVLCGAASLIPVVGMKLVYVPVAIYLFVRAFMMAPTELVWFPLVFLVVAFVLVDFIPDMIIRPYVSGRDLHLGSIMLAYILGPLLFGWYGIFLGPMLLIVTVHFVREVLPVLVSETPIRPYSIDPAVARIPRDPSDESEVGPDLEAATAALEAESESSSSRELESESESELETESEPKSERERMGGGEDENGNRK